MRNRLFEPRISHVFAVFKQLSPLKGKSKKL